ncbi:MAG TPA: hotdog domain-containing protein, partial [Bacteroidota bacterium]|nr:hotdog domain-containing protein [Bacteroidota bacterium]
LLLNGMENPAGKLAMFTSINNAKFRRPVVPGDQLTIEVTIGMRRKTIAQMICKAYVAGELAAEAELGTVIVDRNNGTAKE